MIPLSSISIKAEQRNKFLQLYNQYKDLMIHIALGILKNKELAEEAVQDALIRILHHIDDIEEIKCHKTHCWVVYIIRRVSLNKLKYEKRREHESDDRLERDFGDIDTVEDKAIWGIKIEQIIKGLDYIDDYCNVIIYKYYFGYSDNVLARHYNISSDAVRKRIERCKKKLKQYLLRHGKEFDDEKTE